MRKDIKKSSYYVWFLGAQEARGLRGAEYVAPVVRSLVEREREVEPFKVTLQVSHKGLKIVQNVPATHPVATPPGLVGGKHHPGGTAATGKQHLLASAANKTETVKHLIPHHAVTCVLQQEDIVSCILLLYNPVTKCPVHVHAYRCDSVETAQILCGQLQTLIERPENQKKLAEIEARLRAKGLLPPAGAPPPHHNQSRRPPNGGGSDGRSTSTRESESSGGSSSERLNGLGGGSGSAAASGREERIANLYDSLAAELREKLGATADPNKSRGSMHPPILLPPRDYDTVHRQKGNLASVDRRRCLNASIVGVNAKNVKNLAGEDTTTPGTGATCSNNNNNNNNATNNNNNNNNHHVASGKRASAGMSPPAAQTGRGGLVGSSGGSSGIGSDHAPSPDNESDPRYLDNASSSDEEWNEEPSEDSLFLVQPGRGGGALSGWRVSGARELSLPRARRVHSSGIDSPAASPSPTSPGSAPGAPPLLLPGSGSLPRSAEMTPLRRTGRHSSPNSQPNDHRDGYSRHPSREDEDDMPGRLRARRPNAAEDRQRAARSPPRSPSPPMSPLRGSIASMSGPMSPRERFQDAKEKFLSLERERLEEQERVMQLNLEKRRAAHQQQQQQQQASPPRHSPQGVVEPPISPAVLSGPRPRPRPRRPSWSRSRDSDDEVLDSRYYDEQEDDDDFSGNAAPTGGRQRIIAAVNRRMSRESLDDDVEPDYPVRHAARPPRPDAFPPASFRRDAPHGGGDSLVEPVLRARHDSSREVASREGPQRYSGREPPSSSAAPGRDVGAPPSGRSAVSRSRSVHREQDRYRSPARGYPSPTRRPRDESSPERNPRPAPRTMYPGEGSEDHSGGRFRAAHVAYDDDLDIPLERYRNSNPRPAPRHTPFPARDDDDVPGGPDPRDPRAYLADKKRRSVFEVMEDERRRHSNELAQEFKRRSYQDGSGSYQELDERERYPGLDRDSAREPSMPAPPSSRQVSARYRHSYAEPPPRHHELLHRANSAVTSPRVGIAAVHPY